jgi:hypothetical protein
MSGCGKAFVLGPRHWAPTVESEWDRACLGNEIR